MARVRVSTTVDAELLSQARAIDPDGTDSALVEAALTELLRQHRRAEIDAQYQRAYADGNHTVDEWGDMNEWLDAAVATRTPDDDD